MLTQKDIEQPKHPIIKQLEDQFDYIVAIGDVHGCYQELYILLQKLNGIVYKNTAIIFLGDLIDRGPDPAEVVYLVRGLQKDIKNVYPLKGNHEEKHLRYAYHQLNSCKNPMQVNSEFLLTHEQLSKHNLKWLALFPSAITWRNWIFTHAGLSPMGFKLPLKVFLRTRYLEYNETKKTWDLSKTWQNLDGEWCHLPKARHWTEIYTGSNNVVYGHEPYKGVKITQNNNSGTCFGIDTECYKTGKLTAMILDCKDESYKFVQTETT
jgi:bis(5'-nucleosyl)-tetraphosphatase (symmetrical)